MTDDAKYANADEVPPPLPFMARDPLEAFRQQKIREVHHLITPALFPLRERVKRDFALLLRGWGEAATKAAQEAK